MEWSLSPEIFQQFLLCLARVGALVASLPILSGQSTPGRVRVGLAVMLALVIFPVVRDGLPGAFPSSLELGVLMVQEALLGLAVGFTSRLIFTAVELGGAIAGYQMGFAAANVFDPQTQSQIALISQFQNVLAVLLFLALDVHHLFLRALLRSYHLLPPGEVLFSGEGTAFLMELAGGMFDLGIRLSAPILAVLLVSGFVLGILSRVFPQLNVFLLSFPLNIGLSFMIMGLTLGIVVALLTREFGDLEERLFVLLNLLRG